MTFHWFPICSVLCSFDIWTIPQVQKSKLYSGFTAMYFDSHRSKLVYPAGTLCEPSHPI